MYQAVHILKTLNVIGVNVAVTIIALAGVAMVAAVAVASLLVQSSSATTDVMNTTTATTNNVSNAALGNLFQIVEFETSTITPINETYIEVSTENKVTVIPPNATGGTTINATETTNATANILPNGLAVSKGKSILVTEGDDDDSAAEQENATSTFVQITRFNPDGTAVGTGVAYFSTNSTGQLAFLNNMVGIMQSEFSSEGGSIRTWEWKGGTLPFESGAAAAPTMGNQTTITSTLE